MKFPLVAALLAGSVLLAGAQAPAPGPGGGRNAAGNCGLIYGKDHSLTICAPNGWVLDNGIMNDQGIYAVFYPEGSSWDESKESGTIMYVNVVGRPGGRPVKKMMADDAKEAEHDAPGTVTKEGTPIAVGDLSVPVLRFMPGGFNRYEAVAYIGEEKVLVMLVISSKNEQIFAQDYAAFVKLVQSYKFLSSHVTVEHK